MNPVLMLTSFLGELVVSYKRETLSAKVQLLDSDAHWRYSVFFKQQIVDVDPSHILISKCVVDGSIVWRCDDKSFIQDEELANAVGNEIDRMLLDNPAPQA